MAIIYGTNGAESLIGTTTADDIHGFGGNDTLDGRGGDDWLFGGSGNDRLIGGTGFNDYWGNSGYDIFAMSRRGSAGFSDDLIRDFTFDIDRIDVSAWGVSDFSQIQALLFVDGAGNATLNAYYAGYDHLLSIDGVHSSELVASDFVYSTSGAKNETGTSFEDVLFGSRFGDTLNGGGGEDVLLGGFGNDTLIGGAGLDHFDGGAGFDTANFSYSSEAVNVNLGAGLATFPDDSSERLVSIEAVVGSNANNVITGNSAANVLNGLNGNDILNGGRGSDTLIGGAGNDTFVFNASLGPTNIDLIDDFAAPSDTIRLENAIFLALPNGALAASAYAEGNFSTAQDASDRIIYNNTTGGLFYDPDGLGGVGATRFATLDAGLAPSLSNLDFFVV